ncbi:MULTISPECIES: efflux transporter outer membrane subunit [unclassified Neisseria]|uniref:efflux transporter outer membrane subunit n=1 Tax=unclassified Neisseria TaxID=2623750 RepID=UPI00266676BC|nr:MULTISPECIES: efflux transporter outer membrane subunit [unclassified Neisseria]MDO1509920.1 efflux transporter outer membrane subunit [Neisseria sp. MVDL19-042950]MDO1516119.1 efflux transporter outer membrane subunit [Neisseria sp. MVDL18-041461]MDO1563234.1 efflux transporter outer membrane subunit [Neisseria sp. MVDL20-010259]
MKTVNFKPALSAVVAAVVLSACTMIPKYQKPQVSVPETFRHDTQPETAIQAASLGWQDYFTDPRLHRLIELALARNTDLRTAALNAEAIRKQYMIARADLLPGINASGSGQRGRVAADLSTTGTSRVSSSYTVGLGITAYELDLFGRVRSTAEAAKQNYFNSAAARDSAHLSLVATVAKAYFNERYAEEAMKLAQNVLKTREQTYKLTQLKHKAGVVSAIDLRQQEALIESAKADYAAAVQSKEQAQNALAVLINRQLPEDLPAGLPLNKQFKISKLPAGLTSDVLLNRPDIRAAEHSLRQANANIGAARAAFFPSISLTGTIGTGSTELSRLFKGGNGTWAFVPTINLPIFNWGSNKANLDAAKIRQQIQVVNYEAAVQAAFRDVSDALVAREQLDKRYEAAAKQGKSYADYLRLVRLRYKHGVSSALDLLDAERSSYGADTALLGIQRTRLENLADLYKALGGGLKRHTQDGTQQ